jgi:hypothetical protein
MLLPLLLFIQASVLDNWRAEIEKLDQSKVLIMRITEDTPPPADPIARKIVTEVFQSPGFTSQFARAEAMSVTNGKYHFVLINPAQTPEKDYEAVIGHELGHLWLKAQGYPSPVYQGGDAGCLAINAGDAVQHVLIRAELDRRKIDWRDHWLENLEKATRHMERDGPTQPTAPICQRLAQLALWIDVKLGLDPSSWTGWDRFDKAMSAAFPELKRPALEISSQLAKLDLANKAVHRKALAFTFNAMKAAGIEIERKLNETKTP